MQLVNKKNIEVWKDIPGYEGLYLQRRYENS